MSIGVVGDLHLKSHLSYSNYIADGRSAEKKEILDFIVKTFEDCKKVVFMGDNLNYRNNPSDVLRELVALIERFEGKEIFIIGGNHEKRSNGESAIDFLKEVKNPKWHVITNTVETFDDMVFCPFFTKVELETDSNKEGSSIILKKIGTGKILFSHYMISGSTLQSGMAAEILDEIILPADKLSKKFDLIINGHIHTPQTKDNVIITGSIFNNEVGETQKYIWKVNEKTLKTEQIKLPGRGIHKLENPTIEDIEKIKKSSIVKVIITSSKVTSSQLTELKKSLEKFDAYVLLEQIPQTRKKLHFGKGESVLEFSIEKLLEMYAKEKEVDYEKLKKAFELIRI
jgi:DNA repair exonuclease SbcCD nuclease subunit